MRDPKRNGIEIPVVSAALILFSMGPLTASAGGASSALPDCGCYEASVIPQAGGLGLSLSQLGVSEPESLRDLALLEEPSRQASQSGCKSTASSKAIQEAPVASEQSGSARMLATFDPTDPDACERFRRQFRDPANSESPFHGKKVPPSVETGLARIEEGLCGEDRLTQTVSVMLLPLEDARPDAAAPVASSTEATSPAQADAEPQAKKPGRRVLKKYSSGFQFSNTSGGVERSTQAGANFDLELSPVESHELRATFDSSVRAAESKFKDAKERAIANIRYKVNFSDRWGVFDELIGERDMMNNRRYRVQNTVAISFDAINDEDEGNGDSFRLAFNLGPGYIMEAGPNFNDPDLHRLSGRAGVEAQATINRTTQIAAALSHTFSGLTIAGAPELKPMDFSDYETNGRISFKQHLFDPSKSKTGWYIDASFTGAYDSTPIEDAKPFSSISQGGLGFIFQ